MARKIRVGILFGGRSGEHEVSLRSAASIAEALDPRKYEAVPIGITKEGRWLTADASQRLLGAELKPLPRADAGDPSPEVMQSEAAVLERGLPMVLAPDPTQRGTTGAKVDVVFPVLHGTFGEDGTVQGLLELAGIPYVGAGVLGSAAGMDKDVMKRLFREAGLPVAPWVTFLRGEIVEHPRRVAATVEKKFRYPVFVKPANMGSSVGISKVHTRAELQPALEAAAQFDRKVVVERGLNLVLELLQLTIIGNAIYLEMHHRLRDPLRISLVDALQAASSIAADGQHRMDYRMNLQVCRHHHADRIHQERHVVGHHLQQAAPPRGLVRIQYPHAGLARATLPHEIQQAGDHSRPLRHRVQFDVTGGNALEEKTAKSIRLLQLRR